MHLRLALAWLALLAGTSAVAADAAAPSPVRFSALAIVDAVHADAPAFSTALGHLHLGLDGDLAALGSKATTFRLEVIADYGGKPDGRVGTLQGLSSIEVGRSATRLYSAWLQHAFSADVDVLAGLYDLNSEFYVTEASSLLIHPAFGIGAELAQTGANGPSIFPDLAAGVRLRARSPRGHYLQAVILAATPGDPDHPGRVAVRIARRDGALVVAELGWQAVGRDDDGVGRAGFGVWGYSEPAERSDGLGRATRAGAYALGQMSLGRTGGQRITGFARAGVAAPGIDPIAVALDAGLRGRKARGGGGPDAWSVGVALARLDRASIAARAARGDVAAHRVEAAFEVGARWELGSGMAIQPLAQHVRHVAGRRESATIVGVRWVWSLPGGGE